MKLRSLLVAVVILSSISGSAWAKGGNGNGGSSTPLLTPTEEANIIYLREEEKLARDVYLALYDRWKARIFLNISASEQTHMDSVEGLIANYNLTDPVVDDSSCVFTNSDFTGLCNDLIAKGNESLEAALQAGVTIEEMDIDDIQAMLLDTDKTDVGNVLSNLLSGSYNHLAAFEKNL